MTIEKDSKMAESYKKALAKSYLIVQDKFTIPSEQLNRQTEIPLKFQPVGANTQFPSVDGNLEVMVACYFETMIQINHVFLDENGLHFKVRYEQGVDFQRWNTEGDCEIDSIRFFPDLLKPNYANRLQNVDRGPNNTLWVLRNADPVFHVYGLSTRSQKGRLMLIDRILVEEAKEKGRYLHSTLLEHPDLYTVESPGNLEEWTVRKYLFVDGKFKLQEDLYRLPKYTFGLSRRPGDNALWHLTDFRVTETESKQSYLKLVTRVIRLPEKDILVPDYEVPKELPEGSIKPGLYRRDKLVVPGVFGQSLAFLDFPNNKGVLLYCSGGEYPAAFGRPGTITYIPEKMFD